jgi:hypothetical protein
MNKLIIMPEVEDIRLFQSGGHDRATNDACNKKREDILATILYVDDEYLNHPEFGSMWTSVREKFLAVLTPLCNDEPFKRIVIKQKGGMTYNYDFLVTFLGQLNEKTNSRSLVKEVKLEFKHNNSTVLDLAQFLELFDKDCKTKFEICDVSYAEFFYDIYLDQYLQLEEGITEPKPTRDIYLKNVYDIKYKHPFFKNMYDTKNNKTKQKRKLASDSVADYLRQYSPIFQFEKILEKIKESQTGKSFLLWDCENFHIQELHVGDVQITGIKENSLQASYFDLALVNFEYDLRVRVNWGNNACVANPRWKFTFINRT